MNTLYSFLLVLVIAAAAQAFAPAATSGRASSTGLSAFEGRKLTAAENAYARGGKPSWEFEADTMYVVEPEPKKKKAVVAKKVVKKAVKKAAAGPAKKAAFSFSFGKK